MNRGKRAMTSKLRKKMAKEIRTAQGRYPLPEERQYSDELTAKEMLKKYPKKRAKKYQEALESTLKHSAAKKAKRTKKRSKRTTPGEVHQESTPSIVHSEGLRWIRTLTKQTQAKRKIQDHKGRRKK